MEKFSEACAPHVVAGGRHRAWLRLPHRRPRHAHPGERAHHRRASVCEPDVVREFIGRTHYQIANDAGRSADAVLKGTVISAQAAPLTYDAQTGRISSAVVTVSMKVSLADHAGHILFENPNYTFRQQYQVSREVTSFFEEETPALQRMSQDFARTLVGDILEAF
jgi:Lipopolysaccharide-assembly